MRTSISALITKAAAQHMITSSIDPTIKFTTKSHYGGPELVYVTSAHKDPLNTLTNSKTLSPRHVQALKDLGFSFKGDAGPEKTL